MSMPLIGFCIFAGLIGMMILIIVVDLLVRVYMDRRDERERRIRNTEINKFNMGAFKGTKEWHQ